MPFTRRVSNGRHVIRVDLQTLGELINIRISSSANGTLLINSWIRDFAFVVHGREGKVDYLGEYSAIMSASAPGGSGTNGESSRTLARASRIRRNSGLSRLKKSINDW